MRITHKAIFEISSYQLGANLENLSNANEVITTGKRINKISDDPVGIAQVLDLKTGISNLEQLERNITTGTSWLTAGETALSSVSDLLVEAKTIAEQLANGTYDATQRAVAAGRISGILRQTVQFSNTIVNGQYIFAGTKTNIQPFALNSDANPEMVTYSGNDSEFAVKISKDAIVPVGYNGEDVFGETTVRIDDSNNTIDLREVMTAAGPVTVESDLSAQVPDGTYTHDQLAAALQTAMINSSATPFELSNFAVGGALGFADITNVAVSDNTALTVADTALLDWDGANWAWNPAGDPSATGTNNYPNAAILAGGTDQMVQIDFDGDLSADVTVNLANAAVLGDSVGFDISAGGNSIDYSITYDATENIEAFTIEDTPGGNDLDELQILWSTGQNETTNIAHVMGFANRGDDSTASTVTYTGDAHIQWGIFTTLTDLKHCLETNNENGVARIMPVLDTHFKDIESIVSGSGSNQIRMNIRENVIIDMKLSYTTRQARLEDADVVEALSLLKLREFAYEASLASSSRVMSMSLVDYL